MYESVLEHQHTSQDVALRLPALKCHICTNLVSRIHGASEVVAVGMIQEPVPGDRDNKTTGSSLHTSNILQEVPLLVVAIQLKSTSISPTDSPSVFKAALITLSLCIDMTLTALLR